MEVSRGWWEGNSWRSTIIAQADEAYFIALLSWLSLSNQIIHFKVLVGDAGDECYDGVLYIRELIAFPQ